VDWKDVGRVVARTAPALGVALGGPAGGAIGSMVAAAFGSDADPEAVSQAIAADPEAAVRLREIELRHAEVLASLAVQQYEAQLADVQQARTTHKDHWMPGGDPGEQQRGDLPHRGPVDRRLRYVGGVLVGF